MVGVWEGGSGGGGGGGSDEGWMEGRVEIMVLIY